MDARNLAAERRDRLWLDESSGDFAIFEDEVAQTTRAEDWPHASEIAKNIPIYDGEAVRRTAQSVRTRRELMAEWAAVFATGPGVIVIRAAMDDLAVVDRATAVFETIIETEKAGSGGGGDHFAKPGANDRVWNALEKHCLADPKNFARYYASEAVAMTSEAWLGRGYQMTAQVNRVNPGGAAQTPHRDYHLGFMSPEQMTAFPAHIHRISPLLTLQGAIAHGDMPIESGPTVLLPYSQTFFEGYLAFGREPFQRYFADHAVQLPLAKGDAVFFNPALMHGAGANQSSDIRRMANLLQVSSAFGRAMEAVDRSRMTLALYPALRAASAAGELSAAAIANAVAASAEGYAFPTNLDRDPPIGGRAPKTQAEHVHAALAAGEDAETFVSRITAHDARRSA
ncbi:phytanoyl-CoA dioxygenase family protein [Jiella sp. MQZ9-1]|uniref:Phytanoyl-CoA dioxygenase family protein n=1 Tax=Jiella flava TaxID=2816857 RepID=A0A939G0U3_9HYPH|nr:phytanoyl-CoA dioxygenase family protein [Jiella flava]MBO0664419.1 phytanoyl-CoA dioxygenase family protein [Jiella flava]MCD2473055.1 phytanoyl-CoA dioxygenase family protein [Jiella flava]